MQLSGRSLLTESFRSDLPLRGHNYGVCYAIVRSPQPHQMQINYYYYYYYYYYCYCCWYYYYYYYYPRCSAGIQSMSQPAAAAARPQFYIPGYNTIMDHAQYAIIHNLRQDCRMVTR